MTVPVDVWTCPDCHHTYRCPGHWEAEVFLAARRAAQKVHARKHGRALLLERRRRWDDPAPGEDAGGGQ